MSRLYHTTVWDENLLIKRLIKCEIALVLTILHLC